MLADLNFSTTPMLIFERLDLGLYYSSFSQLNPSDSRLVIFVAHCLFRFCLIRHGVVMSSDVRGSAQEVLRCWVGAIISCGCANWNEIH